MQRATEAAVAEVPSVQLTTVVIPRDGTGIQAGLDQLVAASPTAVVVGLSERGGTPMINAITGSGLAPDQRWVTSGTLVAMRASQQAGWRFVQRPEAPTVASTPFQAAFLEDAAALPASAR